MYPSVRSMKQSTKNYYLLFNKQGYFFSSRFTDAELVAAPSLFPPVYARPGCRVRAGQTSCAGVRGAGRVSSVAVAPCTRALHRDSDRAPPPVNLNLSEKIFSGGCTADTRKYLLR